MNITDNKKMLDFLTMSKEEENNLMDQAFEDSCNNPENMSYWFPKITNSTTASGTSLRIPKTKIILFSREQWEWLRSDSYHPEALKNMNTFFLDQLADFCEGEKLFLKTGIFSNKFDFSTTVVKNRQYMAKQFLDIFYKSMLVVQKERTRLF